MTKWINILLVMCVALTAVGCDGSEDEVVALPVLKAIDVQADPATGRDPVTGAPTGTTGRYTFFDLSSNQVILDRDNDDRSDSTSTKWDLAFQASNIIVNSAATGGGSGGVVIVDADFDAVSEAPSSGYSTGTVGLESSSSSAWGTYDPASMLVFPLAGKTLVIKTADGKYAKVRVVSYYQGAPEVPDAFVHQSRYFAFDFSYQPDGSRNLTEQ
jgi:hypothetical protein